MVPACSHRVSRVPWYSGSLCVTSRFAYGAFTLSGGSSQYPSASLGESRMRSEPHSRRSGLGSSAFARRYLRNHCCFLFLRLLRCFSSPGSPRMPMYSAYGDWLFASRVSPFRHPWITGYLLLPTAFRSLSRLSSALSAKASVLRPFLLDLSPFGDRQPVACSLSRCKSCSRILYGFCCLLCLFFGYIPSGI